MRGPRWGVWSGKWWMFQYSLDGTFSLGIHLDPVRREEYGPYMDLHLVTCALSLGRNPGKANNDSLMRGY